MPINLAITPANAGAHPTIAFTGGVDVLIGDKEAAKKLNITTKTVQARWDALVIEKANANYPALEIKKIYLQREINDGQHYRVHLVSNFAHLTPVITEDDYVGLSVKIAAKLNAVPVISDFFVKDIIAGKLTQLNSEKDTVSMAFNITATETTSLTIADAHTDTNTVAHEINYSIAGKLFGVGLTAGGKHTFTSSESDMHTETKLSQKAIAIASTVTVPVPKNEQRTVTMLAKLYEGTVTMAMTASLTGYLCFRAYPHNRLPGFLKTTAVYLVKGEDLTGANVWPLRLKNLRESEANRTNLKRKVNFKFNGDVNSVTFNPSDPKKSAAVRVLEAPDSDDNAILQAITELKTAEKPAKTVDQIIGEATLSVNQQGDTTVYLNIPINDVDFFTDSIALRNADNDDVYEFLYAKILELNPQGKVFLGNKKKKKDLRIKGI